MLLSKPFRNICVKTQGYPTTSCQIGKAAALPADNRSKKVFILSRKLHKTLLAVALAASLWAALPAVQIGTSAEAAPNSAVSGGYPIGGSVTTVRPSFPIQLNGMQLDAFHSRYPFLFYSDITYMPLTWNNLQALGMEMLWDSTNGLMIWNNRPSPPPLRLAPPEKDLVEQPGNAKSYAAQIAQGRIQLNGIKIDNAAELYPFLSFREVVYMPLTWRLTHDILQIDLRWDSEGGLALVGGQHMFGDILGDDETYLYIRSNWLDNPDKSLIRVAKADFAVSWGNQGELQALTELLQTKQAALPFRGQPVELIRKDRELYFGGHLLYTLTDQDVWEAADWGPPVHTYRQFSAGDQGTVISVNLRLPLPVIGPNWGTTHTFFVSRDGVVTRWDAFDQELAAVIPNPDGTAWIATEQRTSRYGADIAGMAKLGLLDTQGNLQMLNDSFSRSMIFVHGLRSTSPTDAEGRLYAVLSPYPAPVSGPVPTTDNGQPDQRPGLYRMTTKLEMQLLTEQVSPRGRYYMDSAGSLYVQHPNNTIENWANGDTHSWLDNELAQADK